MRFGYLVMLLSIALPAVAAILFYQEWSGISNTAKLTLQLGLAAPALSLIFSILANRFIRKDEKLVKSMDRLR